MDSKLYSEKLPLPVNTNPSPPSTRAGLTSPLRSRRSLLILPFLCLYILLHYTPLPHFAYNLITPTSATLPPSRPPFEVIPPYDVPSEARLSVPPPALACPAIDAARYSHLISTPHASANGTENAKILIALNLFNSESVLPSLIDLVSHLAGFLGREKIAVVVFENGSKDETKTLLSKWRRMLDDGGVQNLIWSSDWYTDWRRVDRIEQLAVFRNIVTSPLRAPFPSFPAPEEFSTVLFLNDVFTCPNDALELLHQRETQEASVSCGLDWMRKHGRGKTRRGDAVFYDSWVTRSLTGNTLRPQLDLFRQWRDGVNHLFQNPGEEKYRKRYELGLPLPVYSCWNGMAAFDARPFRGDTLSPDASLKEKPVLFRSGAEKLEGECSASECKLIAKDFWRRGFNRFVLVPTVRSTYDPSLYSDPYLVELASRRPIDPPASGRDGERIAWSEVPSPAKVVCWSWHRRIRFDFWWMARWENPV